MLGKPFADPAALAALTRRALLGRAAKATATLVISQALLNCGADAATSATATSVASGGGYAGVINQGVTIA